MSDVKLSRKDRLDRIITYAKKIILENKIKHSDDLQSVLEKYMVVNWGLSESARRDYIKTLDTVLENDIIELDLKFKVPRTNLNSEKYQQEISKLKLFLNVFKELQGEDKDEVSKTDLVNALLKTAQFNRDEAQNNITKAHLHGMIYERRPGFYASA